MKITRNSRESTPGPAGWFTGTVYIDTVAMPSPPSRLGAAIVHFTPGRWALPTPRRADRCDPRG